MSDERSLLLRRLETAQADCMDDGQAAAAILLQDARAAIIRIRNEIIEECAKACENLRHVDYPAETSEWSSGTFDCAQAIRALRTEK